MDAIKAAEIIRAALDRAKQGEVLPCCLCDAPAHNRGIYVPEKPGTLGEPLGKHRLVMYALCDDCLGPEEYPSPLTLARIERKLIANLTASTN
jgi:hypothetical protein